MRLHGKNAIVTGGAGGIGRAITEAFAREGAKVIIADVDPERGEAAAASIGSKTGPVVFKEVDVSSREAVASLVKDAVAELGSLDVMVNNAGVRAGPWSQTIGVNLSGVLFGLRYASRAMAESGGGSIINTGSVLGIAGGGGQIDTGVDAYVAAKHGVIGLTKEFALQYGPQGVRVNCICPGLIATPMIDNLLEDPEWQPRMEAMTPLRRLGSPEEISPLYTFLASDEASYVTGGVFMVDGGLSAGLAGGLVAGGGLSG